MKRLPIRTLRPQLHTNDTPRNIRNGIFRGVSIIVGFALRRLLPSKRIGLRRYSSSTSGSFIVW